MSDKAAASGIPSDDAIRRARGRVVASLTATFGVEHLELIEDAVQDALVSAIKLWSQANTPADPAAWLYRASRNRLTDILRREQRHTALDERLLPAQPDEWSEPLVRDDELRMLLMCCHPVLSPTARAALALSCVAGLTAPQIAGALLITEAAARQVLVRAKRQLREESVDLALATGVEERLDSALATLYLMFNEGYCAFDGEQLVRPELCHEAMRMCGMLLDSPLTAQPQTYALGALLFFQGARLSARTDGHGNALRLAEQDRNVWDRSLITIAFDLLGKAASGPLVTTYHLEAEIASYHARAESLESTDWDSIVKAYDALIGLNPSPVIRLNRAVAIAEQHGPAAALLELDALEAIPILATYPFFHLTRGHLLARIGRQTESRAAFARALSMATSQPVHRFVAAHMEIEPMSKNALVDRLQAPFDHASHA